MQPKPTLADRWHFSSTIKLSIVLALFLTTAVVVGFVFWSTSGIDARAQERQLAMVSQVMASNLQRIEQNLASVGYSDDALLHTSPQFDDDWVDRNIGKRMHDVFMHGTTVVLDADNTPLYMMRDGQRVDPMAFSWISTQLMPLVETLRGATPKPGAGVSDVVTPGGELSLVAASFIASDTGRLASEDAGQVIVSIMPLGTAVAQRLAKIYQFDDARFTLTASVNQDRAMYPLLNRTGRIMGFLEWKRDRPGLLMLRQTGPALTIGFLVAALAVVLLLRQLSRYATAIETSRRLAEHQARTDALTGLPNRARFDAYLASLLGAPAKVNRHLSLFMLDLDRFKQVNDTLGHQAGDALIKAVGGRLQDVVGPVMIARLGGDEFAILATSENRPIDTLGLSTRIIDVIEHPFDLGSFKAHVGVSIGIVSVADGGHEPHELMRKADIALYEAKAGGRNRAVVFEERMHEHLQLQHTIEEELRSALQRTDQLSIAFQPLVDQQTRRVVGAEALARWDHPGFGPISPARFIPVAENTGLIEALGEFVLRRACEIGATAPGRTIAVNISPTQLRNPRFSNEVFDILHQTGMRPTDLELEITESILLDDEHVSAHNLRTFRTAGIHIALDDFGTGYSSLSYLKRYPVDRIKIDRSFVSQLAPNHVSVAITQAIVTLAHALDIEVTAEGVETDAQAEILGTLGCNTMQGFLFSGAVDPTEIIRVFDAPENVLQRRRRVQAAA